MLLSIYIPQSFARGGDPARIAAQVVSGIGFLGAGAIIKLGNNIRGLTTSASIWFIAAVGLTIGAGMYLIAGAAVVMGLITLIILERLEMKLFPTERYKTLEITYKDNAPSTREALDILKEAGIRLQSMDVNQGSKDKKTKLRLLVRVPNTVDIASTAKSIKSSGNVAKVEIKEKY
jgi:putative Mg2+ transporter-C (MgtC) family protein